MIYTNGFYHYTSDGVQTINISITERYTKCINFIFFKIGIGQKLNKAYIRIEPVNNEFYDESVIDSIIDYLKQNNVSGFRFISNRINSSKLALTIAKRMNFEKEKSYYSSNSVRLYRPLEISKYFKFLSN